MLILDIVALTAAGLLVGNELSIAAFVHPVLCRLPDPVHVGAATAIARLLGRVMPFWYALVIILTGCVALVDRHDAGSWSPVITASAGLFALSIVYTIAALVPINNRIAAWTDESKPADWKQFRARWDLLHRWRVLLLTIAFLFLTVGILTRHKL